MLRVEQMTDYALVALAALRRSGRPMPSPAVATATGLPASASARVLKDLCAAGLATSKLGRAGGYEAARRPGLTVLDVVEALEGPVRVAACVGGERTCRAQSSCPSRGRWGEVNEAVRSALASVSVDDFSRPAERQQGGSACSC